MGVAVLVALGVFAVPALANPTPGMKLEDDDSTCTAGFAAEGPDGSFYLLTAGHCDDGGSVQWTDAGANPLGHVAATDYDGYERDAAIIRLEPGAGRPVGSVDGRYPVRDVLSRSQIHPGLPLCKVGATTGETCGLVIAVDDTTVEASVFSLEGDSGSPAFVKNPDGTVSAVGLLVGSPVDDDYTTYFTMVDPLLAEWGLRLLP